MPWRSSSSASAWSRGRIALGHVRPGALGAGGEVGRELAAHLVGGLGDRRNRLQARRDVGRDPAGQRQRVALGGDDREPGAARAALLVGHAHGAVERRPGVAVAGVEQVEALAREVEPAPVVEDAGVGAADLGLERPLVVGHAWVERLGGRREVVRAVDALLVEVDVDGGPPAVVERQPRARLGLRPPGPVAVEVEEVVVKAAAGPRLVVLAAVGGPGLGGRRAAGGSPGRSALGRRG